MSPAWAPGSATGIGSLPGTDPDEAMRTVLGELPQLPHLPELPARGPGAGMIGRAAALLVDLPVEIAPSGWRVTARGGAELRQARELLARDLDALQTVAGEHSGALKIQITGPWTPAAGIELPTGHRILTDHGAVRDLVASLAEGVRVHCAEVQARVPGASLVVQLDEPSLPAVLRGTLPTASGYGTVRSIEASVVESGLRDVLSVVPPDGRIVHCCAPDVPLGLLRAAGADAVAIDATLIGTSALDELGTFVDGGGSLLLGVVPSADASVTHANGLDAVWRIWRTLGFRDDEAAARIVPTPACGLAGATPDYARHAMRTVRDVGRALLDASA